MWIVFKDVPDQDDESLADVVVNGKTVGRVWRELSRVYTKRGVPTPSFKSKWFARRVDAPDDEDDVGRGEARATSHKGDGFFSRVEAANAMCKAD